MMARPMGAIRLKRVNPICLLLIGVVCFVYFLFVPSSNGSSRSAALVNQVNSLKPPSFSYRKDVGVDGSVPEKAPPVVRYHLNDVTTTSDPIGRRESVLILTPMVRFYPEYWENLLKLAYPRDLITLGFIIPKSAQGDAAVASLREAVNKVQRGSKAHLRFNKVVILRQDFEDDLPSQREEVRHQRELQKKRRSGMAKARNSLLFTTLEPAISWVLWLDADIVETPPGLIQDLASHNKPILAPNVFQRYTDAESKQPAERPYDFNNWQDSETARKLAASMGPEELLLEGYADLPTYRTLMGHVTDPVSMAGVKEILHKELPLDGVGGAALLVKAEIHRDGAMFPPFVFYHLIESEGFAKMAKRLGHQAWGLPNYKVYHYNE